MKYAILALVLTLVCVVVVWRRITSASIVLVENPTLTNGVLSASINNNGTKKLQIVVEGPDIGMVRSSSSWVLLTGSFNLVVEPASEEGFAGLNIGVVPPGTVFFPLWPEENPSVHTAVWTIPPLGLSFGERREGYHRQEIGQIRYSHGKTIRLFLNISK